MMIKMAQMLCFACLVVLCYILRIKRLNLHGGRPETFFSLRVQQGTIY